LMASSMVMLNSPNQGMDFLARLYPAVQGKI
jgi:hypothetical protein